MQEPTETLVKLRNDFKQIVYMVLKDGRWRVTRLNTQMKKEKHRQHIKTIFLLLFTTVEFMFPYSHNNQSVNV